MSASYGQRQRVRKRAVPTSDEMATVDKLRTTVFKPSTNGVVERFHRTLNAMLGKVMNESQRDWDDRLPYVLAAYRASVHDSTGFTPNRLFLGRESRMPVDLAIGLSSEDRDPEQTTDDYVRHQEDLAQESYRLVREHLQTRAERRKQPYDTRARAESFKVGECVWYHHPRRYQQKSPKWQKNFIGPYLVVREIPPVNLVLQRSRTSKPFVVHTDKIKRCYGGTPESWLPSDPTDLPAEESRVESRVPVLSDAIADQSQTPWVWGDTEGSETAVRVSPGRRTRTPPRYLRDYVC